METYRLETTGVASIGVDAGGEAHAHAYDHVNAYDHVKACGNDNAVRHPSPPVAHRFRFFGPTCTRNTARVTTSPAAFFITTGMS